MNNINTLTTGTINGLNDLSLDTLYATNLNSDTIDGNLIYYNRIEGNEIIVDTRLTLTNTGVISVGNVLISDIELTYLDGVSSNIQTQINNINTNNSDLITTVNTHTTQITALQTSDTAQNTTLATHTTQISALQTSDTAQNTSITALNSAVNGQTNSITNLQTSDSAQNATLATHTSQITALQNDVSDLQISDASQTTDITTLQNKTVWQSSTGTSTVFSKQLNIPNGNIGFINSLLPNNFYIQSNLASGNNINLNSGLANIYLQSQNVYLGKTDATTGRKSNLLMLASDGVTWETQTSAFTDTLKNNYDSVVSKIQNITSADTTGTYINKKVAISSNGSCVDTIGTFTSVSGLNTSSQRVWFIGNEGIDRKLFISNDFPESVNIRCGAKSLADPAKGWRPLNIFSNGINLYRGGTEPGNTQYYLGSYGSNQGSELDNNFYISSNGVNNLLLSSGIGNTFISGSSVSLSSNTVWIGGATPASNGRYSNINMLNAAGSAWETQSTAFTDTIRQEIATSTDKFTKASVFGSSKGKISFQANFDILGSAIGTISLLNNTVYGPSFFSLNVGIYFRNNGFTSLFDTDGKFISAEGKTNFSMSFEMQFLCKNSAVSTIMSRISIRSNPFVQIESTQFQGIQYRTPFAFNENIMYNVGPLKHLLEVGQYIYLITDYEFTTQSEGTQTNMNGRFTMDRNVL